MTTTSTDSEILEGCPSPRHIGDSRLSVRESSSTDRGGQERTCAARRRACYCRQPRARNCFSSTGLSAAGHDGTALPNRDRRIDNPTFHAW